MATRNFGLRQRIARCSFFLGFRSHRALRIRERITIFREPDGKSFSSFFYVTFSDWIFILENRDANSRENEVMMRSIFERRNFNVIIQIEVILWNSL